MNEPHDEFDELLAPLRGVEPTQSMRDANRRAALEAIVATPAIATPWWRRSVAVPVPLAMALAASLLLAVTLSWRSNRPPVAEEPTPPAIRFAIVKPSAFGETTSDCRVEHSYVGSLQSAAFTSLTPPLGLGGSS